MQKLSTPTGLMIRIPETRRLSRVNTGWFTLEQDTILTEEPPPGTGPIDDARISADYVRSLLTTASLSTPR